MSVQFNPSCLPSALADITTYNSALQNLEEEEVTTLLDTLTCPVSRNLKKNATLLGCGHSFNLSPIERILEKAMPKCPICRTPITSVTVDIDTSNTVTAVCQLYRKLKIPISINEPKGLSTTEKESRIAAMQETLRHKLEAEIREETRRDLNQERSALESRISADVRTRYKDILKNTEKQAYEKGMRAAKRIDEDDLNAARVSGYREGYDKGISEQKRHTIELLTKKTKGKKALSEHKKESHRNHKIQRTFKT